MVIPGLLRRAGHTLARQTVRNLANQASSSGDPNNPNSSIDDVGLGIDLMDAVDAVADELHGEDHLAKQSIKAALVSKLVCHDDVPVLSATTVVPDSLEGTVLTTISTKNRNICRKSQELEKRRRLVLLRKEIFFRGLQSGYKIVEAKVIAEKALSEAEKSVLQERTASASRVERSSSEMERDDREQRLYDYALRLTREVMEGDGNNEIPFDEDSGMSPDWSFTSTGSAADRTNSRRSRAKNRLRIRIMEALQLNRTWKREYWTEWDLEAARISSMSIDEQEALRQQQAFREWREHEKNLLYPLVKEHQTCRTEAEETHDHHLYLENHLAALGIPDSGPISNFMHLVCVGLSKNPYLTLSKKMDHLQWFAEFFNEQSEKQLLQMNSSIDS